MTEKKETCIFDFDAEQLIQLKDMRLKDMESKYFEVSSRETDFKELKLTNDKLRNAYVSKATLNLRIKLDLARFELKQQENMLTIINDLLKLRMQEVKTE